MLATFSVLKDHVKLKVRQDSVSIDNMVFKLHYRVTFLALMLSTLLVTSRQYIGEHIRCIIGDKWNDDQVKVINTYCFFMSTFTVPKHMNLTYAELGEIAHPGVGPTSKDDDVVHHAYYQWVPFVLFFQGILFYMPHYIWRRSEGGRLKALVSGLHMASLALRETPLHTQNNMDVPSKGERDEKIRQIREGFLQRIHLNRPWAYSLGLCEVLNFINVLMQIYLTDWFLGGTFLGLGKAVEEHTPGEVDPLDVVFPKVTKCVFHKYGASGSLQNHDALCIMALNIINEKIYVFLWYWYIILAVISGLGLVWRILTMVLHARSMMFNKIVFTMACPGKYDPWKLVTTTHECHYGDWVFLYYIAKNVDNSVFAELLHHLATDLYQRQQLHNRPSEEEIEKEPLTKL